jgi:DNA modification methylase
MPQTIINPYTSGQPSLFEETASEFLLEGGLDTLAGNLETPRPLEMKDKTVDKLTHYLFRYPAKFHPPVVRSLINEYTQPQERILDPFCGSGSLLLEAAVAHRHSVGADVDPVAVLVSSVKTHCFNIKHLTKSCDALLALLEKHQRPEQEYVVRQFEDLNPTQYSEAFILVSSYVPAIPNLLHWFRRYVVIDLAYIRGEMLTVAIPETHRNFFKVCFASIIRRASNADPVPVSGLEVTSHMKRKDALGRVINPFALFAKSIKDSLQAVANFRSRVCTNSKASVFRADALQLNLHIKTPIDAVITSPPYHSAVDYYRRHQLEMYWLGLINGQEERLALKPAYIGQSKVRKNNHIISNNTISAPKARRWEEQIRGVSPERADAFKHYIVSMQKVVNQLARILREKQYAIYVVGDSTWNGLELPTSELFVELSAGQFELVDHLWYPVVNRYMSYQRHNGADINKENVLVFRRTTETS